MLSQTPINVRPLTFGIIYFIITYWCSAFLKNTEITNCFYVIWRIIFASINIRIFSINVVSNSSSNACAHRGNLSRWQAKNSVETTLTTSSSVFSNGSNSPYSSRKAFPAFSDREDGLIYRLAYKFVQVSQSDLYDGSQSCEFKRNGILKLSCGIDRL